jgi:DNA-binding GntR family transcriptional regulator
LIDGQWPDAITGLTQTISAVTVSLEVAKGLSCEPDSSVVAVERVYSDRYGTPVELAFTYYHPTNYVMSMRLRR